MWHKTGSVISRMRYQPWKQVVCWNYEKMLYLDHLRQANLGNTNNCSEYIILFKSTIWHSSIKHVNSPAHIVNFTKHETIHSLELAPSNYLFQAFGSFHECSLLFHLSSSCFILRLKISWMTSHIPCLLPFLLASPARIRAIDIELRQFVVCLTTGDVAISVEMSWYTISHGSFYKTATWCIRCRFNILASTICKSKGRTCVATFTYGFLAVCKIVNSCLKILHVADTCLIVRANDPIFWQGQWFFKTLSIPTTIFVLIGVRF